MSKKALGKKLLAAIQNGKTDEALVLITQAADVAVRDENGMQAIHWASRCGNILVLSYLFEVNKIDVDAKDSKNRRPLHYAVMGDYENIFKFLLDAGAGINKRTINNRTPVHYIAIYGSWKVAQSLTLTTADLNRLDESNMTPLAYAVTERNFAIAAYLKKQGASMILHDEKDQKIIINTWRKKPKTEASDKNIKELHNWFISEIQQDISPKNIGYFLAWGVDINWRDEQGCTPLYYAASQGNEKLVRTLISTYNAEITMRKPAQKASLLEIAKGGAKEFLQQELDNLFTEAAIECDLKRVQELHGLGADINAISKEGFAALHYAILNSNVPLYSYLMEQKANYFISPQFKQSIYEIALAKNHSFIASDLIEKLYDKLFEAIRSFNLPIAQNIFMYPLDWNHIVPHLKQAPLHCAAACGNVEMVKLLLARGARFDLKTLEGETATDLVNKHSGNDNAQLTDADNVIIQMIVQQQRDEALFDAIVQGYTSRAEKALDAGASLTANHKGQTPLQAATQSPFKILMIRFLLLRGANIRELESISMPNDADLNPYMTVKQFMASKQQLSATKRLFDAIERYESLDIIIALLCYGVSICIKAQHRSALHISAQKGSLAELRILFDYAQDQAKAQLNVADANGYRPLFLARSQPEEVLQLLLRHGADPEKAFIGKGIPKLEKLPQCIAEILNLRFMTEETMRNTEQLELFLKAGINPNQQLDNAWSAHIAAQAGNIDAIWLLLKVRADMTQIDRQGRYFWQILSLEKQQALLLRLIQNTKEGSEEIYSQLCKRMLASGVDPLFKDRNQHSPLYHAINTSKNEGVVGELLKYGAELEDPEIIQLLFPTLSLKPKRQPTYMGPPPSFNPPQNKVMPDYSFYPSFTLKKRTRIEQFVEQQLLNRFITVIQSGVLVDVQNFHTKYREKIDLHKMPHNETGLSPLHEAAAYGYREIVAYLVEVGADLFIIGSQNNETIWHVAKLELKPWLMKLAFERAIETMNIPATKSLLADDPKRENIDIKFKSSVNGTVLHMLAAHNEAELVFQLIAEGVSPIEKNFSGHYPNLNKEGHEKLSKIQKLYVMLDAIERSNLVKISELLYPNYENKRTTYVFKEKNEEIDVKMSNYQGITVLHKVAEFFNMFTFAEEFVKRGAYLNAQDNKGRTPLHWAVAAKNINMVSYLVKVLNQQHALIDVRDKEGKTPLHYAAMKGYIDIIGELLDAGANKNARTSTGETPYDLVFVSNIQNHQILKLLQPGQQDFSTPITNLNDRKWFAENANDKKRLSDVEQSVSGLQKTVQHHDTQINNLIERQDKLEYTFQNLCKKYLEINEVVIEAQQQYEELLKREDDINLQIKELKNLQKTSLLTLTAEELSAQIAALKKQLPEEGEYKKWQKGHEQKIEEVKSEHEQLTQHVKKLGEEMEIHNKHVGQYIDLYKRRDEARRKIEEWKNPKLSQFLRILGNKIVEALLTDKIEAKSHFVAQTRGKAGILRTILGWSGNVATIAGAQLGATLLSEGISYLKGNRQTNQAKIRSEAAGGLKSMSLIEEVCAAELTVRYAWQIDKIMEQDLHKVAECLADRVAKILFFIDEEVPLEQRLTDTVQLTRTISKKQGFLKLRNVHLQVEFNRGQKQEWTDEGMFTRPALRVKIKDNPNQYILLSSPEMRPKKYGAILVSEEEAEHIQQSRRGILWERKTITIKTSPAPSGSNQNTQTNSANKQQFWQQNNVPQSPQQFGVSPKK